MATRSVVVLLLLCCCDSLQSLQVKHFYPYGDEIQNGNFGSGTVPNGVSTISRRVNLDVPIRFYNDYYNFLYVSINYVCYIICVNVYINLFDRISTVNEHVALF